MIKFLRSHYQSQQFLPSPFFGAFLNPFFLIRFAICESIKSLIVKNHYSKILDVGCGSKPYKPLFSFDDYIGVDIENPGHSHEQEEVDFYYDGKNLPFEDNSFDFIICTEVLEHVECLDSFIKELYRVLKIKGEIVVTVPFVWDEHEMPYDFRRFTARGVELELVKFGFNLCQKVKVGNTFGVLFQLVWLQVYYALNKWKLVRLFSFSLFYGPIALLINCFTQNTDDHRRLYFGTALKLQKLT